MQQPEPPLVFVVGAPRSGTTLVAKLLCLHPDTAWISNLARRARWAPPANVANRVARHLRRRRRRVWFADGNAYVYGTRRPVTDRIFPQPVEAQPLTDALLGQPGTSAPPEAHRRFASMVSAVARWAGGTTVVLKNVANNRRVGELARHHPTARFVHVIRDGRGVARSLQKVDWWPQAPMWWRDGRPVTAWLADGLDPWMAAVEGWAAEVRALRDGLRDVPADRVHALHYESLVNDPHRSTVALLEFSGLDDPTSVLRELGHLRINNHDERWRQELSPAQLELFGQIAGADLIDLGYLTGR